MTKDFNQLAEQLGTSFDSKDLLKQAFVHRSFLNENPRQGLSHNERLEFLGDAVLEHIVTEYLYQSYPDKAEGELTSLRAALVNAKMLSQVAAEIGFNDFLLLSAGESQEMGKARQYILANTFEAFVGALYLDQGMEICKNFIVKNLLGRLDEIIATGSYKDAKSSFQEQAQEHVSITPSYSVLKESGPDHAKHFIVGAFLGEELVAKGEGSSKSEAEQAAAAAALQEKGW